MALTLCTATATANLRCASPSQVGPNGPTWDGHPQPGTVPITSGATRTEPPEVSDAANTHWMCDRSRHEVRGGNRVAGRPDMNRPPASGQYERGLSIQAAQAPRHGRSCDPAQCRSPATRAVSNPSRPDGRPDDTSRSTKSVDLGQQASQQRTSARTAGTVCPSSCGAPAPDLPVSQSGCAVRT